MDEIQIRNFIRLTLKLARSEIKRLGDMVDDDFDGIDGGDLPVIAEIDQALALLPPEGETRHERTSGPTWDYSDKLVWAAQDASGKWWRAATDRALKYCNKSTLIHRPDIEDLGLAHVRMLLSEFGLHYSDEYRKQYRKLKGFRSADGFESLISEYAPKLVMAVMKAEPAPSFEKEIRKARKIIKLLRDWTEPDCYEGLSKADEANLYEINRFADDFLASPPAPSNKGAPDVPTD